MRTAFLLVMALALAACSKKKTPSADASASADARASADASASATTGGETLVREACLSCHSTQMLAQQRLTPAQWSKTVTKMVTWGANLEPAQVGPLVAYLSSNYGPDAGPYELETVTAAAALAEIAPTPDPFPPGSVERGKPLFIDKCSGCHGQDARGQLGVALIDRPFLYRAADVATTIRKGRGKMLPIPMSDSEIADVLAHLRGLHNPIP